MRTGADTGVLYNNAFQDIRVTCVRITETWSGDGIAEVVAGGIVANHCGALRQLAVNKVVAAQIEIAPPMLIVLAWYGALELVACHRA